MTSLRRHALLLVSIVLVTAILIPTCAASEKRLEIVVDDAFYADLDNNGLEDDVQIDLTIYIPPGSPLPRYSEYYLTLILPSGVSHRALIQLVGSFRTIRMTVLWYNSAWEPGWYTLMIDAFAFGGGLYGYSNTTHIFDPPTGSGTGEPHISVMVW